MNRSWAIFYGLSLGMDRQETLDTVYGEFMDLLACQAISKGWSKEKKPMKKMHFDDFIALR